MDAVLFETKALSTPKEVPQWSPYSENGGTIVAVGGPGYVVIACDTRLSVSFSIYTRNQSKLFKLTPQTILGSAGCWCDVLTFVRLIEARLKMYLYEHNRTISTSAAAHLVSIMLYNKRFFPYYVSNIVGGLDEEGNGVVYSYDSVGHCERSTYHATGSSVAFVQPLLDNQVGLKNMESIEKKQPTKEQAMQIIHDSFVSAAERNIHCGDAILFNVITKSGTEERTVPLRKD